jgi:DNA-binding CsgD family transcriptional regulator
MPGPLQVIAASFRAAADFQGRVLAEVGRLQGRGVLRLVDLLFIAKNEAGEIERLIVSGDEDFGVLLSRILPLGSVGLLEPAAGGDSPGFDPSDAVALAESVPPGTALAFLLIEHGWAQPLFDAIAETGGSLLDNGFLTAEAGLFAGAEVAAIEEAAEVISAAQAAEARAVLRAMTAEAEADEVVAAAAEALQALIDAGIVEEAAAHEAMEALSAAGVIIAAADEAASDAITDDTAVVAAADQAAADAITDDAAVVAAADQAASDAITDDAAVVAAADQAAADAVAEDAATVNAASISMAEARVLRYLPTPLTFALIADKLGISRSAAKERAERAYKKLGVHSRAEAVSRARELGLIN